MLGNQGQQLGEYAVLIGIVAMAFVGTQLAISRAVGGRLIDLSHTALGSLVPDEEGTSRSSSTDTVREQGDASRIQTVATSRSFGDSHAGFILAEPHGPFVFQTVKNVNRSITQILGPLVADSGLLEEGYTWEGVEQDGQGRVTAILKKGKQKERIGYGVLGEPTFDDLSGLGWVQLDTNGDGKADKNVLRLSESDFYIAQLSTLREPLRKRVELWKELLGIKDTEPELEFSDSGKRAMEAGVEVGSPFLERISPANLEKASLEELREMYSEYNGRAGTFDEADKATGNISKEDFLTPITWSSSKGKQLIEQDELDSDAWREMANGALQMESTLDQTGEGLEHQKEIQGHLEAAKDFLKVDFDPKADPRFGSDTAISVYLYSGGGEGVARQDFQGAANELDQAYALLVEDIDAALGLDQAAGSDEASRDDMRNFLAHLPRRPRADEHLGDYQQVEVGLGGVNDWLTDVMISPDGHTEAAMYVVLDLDEGFVKDGEFFPASGIPGPGPLTARFAIGKPYEAIKAREGLPPLELIAASGVGLSALEGTEAWIPSSLRAELVAQRAEAGALSFGGTRPPAYNRNIDPNDYTYHR